MYAKKGTAHYDGISLHDHTLRYGDITLFTRSRNTEDGLDLLEDDKLESGGGCKASPDRNKARIQTTRAILGDDLNSAVEEALVDLRIRRLVHQSSADHVEGSDGARHEEPSSKGRKELRDKTVREEFRGLDDHLDLVVARHFRPVKNHRTHDVGLNSTVESHYSLRPVQSTGGLTHGWRLLTLSSHHALRTRHRDQDKWKRLTVLSTSKGLPTTEPRAPAADPAQNLRKKLDLLVTPTEREK